MMEINSRIFGQICIDDSKVLHFVNGIVGFPQLTEFALIHDQEKEGGHPVAAVHAGTAVCTACSQSARHYVGVQSAGGR